MRMSMATRKSGIHIRSLLEIFRCSMCRKSATIRRAERNAVSPDVMGAATTPRIAKAPPTRPNHPLDMMLTITAEFPLIFSGSVTLKNAWAFGGEKIGSRCCPYQGYYTFGNHCSVKDITALSFIGHTACHQRRLCGMEPRYGSTSNADEQHGKYGIVFGIHRFIGKPFRNFRNIGKRNE